MAFIKRLMDHLLNQVLVETLANSRWFQRFAVYTHKLSKEAAEKGIVIEMFGLNYGAERAWLCVGACAVGICCCMPSW
jgi:hypothetical protein